MHKKQKLDPSVLLNLMNKMLSNDESMKERLAAELLNRSRVAKKLKHKTHPDPFLPSVTEPLAQRGSNLRKTVLTPDGQAIPVVLQHELIHMLRLYRDVAVKRRMVVPKQSRQWYFWHGVITCLDAMISDLTGSASQIEKDIQIH